MPIKLFPKKKKYISLPEYEHFIKLRIIILIISGLLIVALGSSALFIYKNIYQIIEQAQLTVLLKSEMGIDPINFQRLEKVRRAWEIKNKKQAITTARDPFEPMVAEAEKEKQESEQE